MASKSSDSEIQLDLNKSKKSLKDREAQSIRSKSKSSSSKKISEARDQGDENSKQSKPKSKARSKSNKTESSKVSSRKLQAKRAALEESFRALEEKEGIQRQILELQQRAERLELKTEIRKLEAEQLVLSEEESESKSSFISDEVEDREERIENWVEETAKHTRSTTNSQVQPEVEATRHTRGNIQEHETKRTQLNPYAREFEMKQNQTEISSKAVMNAIQTLHMPRADMMSFHGEPMKFWTFMRTFDNNVGNYDVDEQAKLARLLQYCKGRAYRVIEGCAAMNEGGYQRARALLTERFGDKFAISTSWIKQVTTGPRIVNSGEAIQEFADELLSFKETLQATDCLSEVNQGVLVKMVERLPVHLQHRWKKQVARVRSLGVNPDINDLVVFMQAAGKEMNDPVYGNLGLMKKQTDSVSTPTAASMGKKGFHGATAVKPSQKPCAACSTTECRSLFKCEAFQRLTPEERLELARKRRLCFNCLRENHSSTECRSESTCTAKGCRIKHTKFLHIDRYRRDQSTKQPETKKKSEDKTEAACSQVSSTTSQEVRGRIALPVLRVNVKARNGTSVETYALLDNGSTNSFCSSGLIRKLKSEGRNTSINLKTLDGQSQVHTSVHTLEVSDVTGQNKAILNQVYATEGPIPVPKDCIVSLEDLENWNHLRDVPIPELQDESVEMLIGQDYPEILTPLEIRTCDGSAKPAPFAVRTLLGWTVNGPIGGQGEREASVHFLSTSSTLEDQVEKFWRIEGAQMSESKGLSLEDRRALEIMQDTTRKEGSHYTTAIPFRDNRELPNNKALAVSRLGGLTKKLERNPTLKKAYEDGMAKLIQKGYAEKVTKEARRGREWYLPHHPVVSPMKNTKVRIVFDCAAKYEGVALNDRVLQGPDLTNGLLGILLRFRQHPVAITADVEAMFHQVKVPEEYRDVLRFIWWPEGDTTKEPDVYRMTVHLFGGTWSPSVCTHALQQTAKDHADEFDQDVVGTVMRDFYVDDCLKSMATVTEANKLVTQLPKLLNKGGFRLHKWLSNRRDVLAAVPEPERATSIQELNFQVLPVERTLGVLWDVDADVFTYTTKKYSKPMTRRALLGAVCSTYDPTGLVSPFTIRGKILVQDLAREKVTWDEPLREEQLNKWKKWLSELEGISGIRIPRCVQSADLNHVVKAELHHFSDASAEAYGAASYLRLIDQGQQVRCNLLFARSRVAPLKQITIPRLELAAAALAVQQDGMLRRELTIQIDQHSFFWTDSEIVLAYIRNTKKRFHTYVANRLSVIHSGSSPNHWRHVRSEMNPADDVSRGLNMQELVHSKRWFHGPPFLHLAVVEEETELQELTLDEDPEVKQAVTACPTSVVEDFTVKFSSWSHLRRVIAWVLRFRDNVRSKALGQPLTTGSLKVKELKTSEETVVQHVQKHAFKEEMRSLRADGKVKRSSRIYKLDPTLTPEGVLVCRTRFRTQDNPLGLAILPKEHHISTLLVRYYHETMGHSGREYTVAEMRKRYWITGVRVIVRRIISKCNRCLRLFSKPSPQRMSDLPQERLAAEKPPFNHTGVDCFGPFLTKSGRKVNKRYGCIFTCMTSRAVHIEVLDSMDTSSFLNALQRFISRRGRPETITCDNGSNLVGAERELRGAIKEWNQQNIDDFLTQRDIGWKFNPPMASHMGGIWERLIRSVRKILSAVMIQQELNDDALTTLMCLVESILNNRPLTVVSDDPSDLEPLTPNHLLMLNPPGFPPPGVFDRKDCYVRKRWRQVQYLANLFWRRWIKEYLPGIQLRSKWMKRSRNLKVGDVVLIMDYGAPRNQWSIARVAEVMTGTDGLVRAARVRNKTTSVIRPVTKLCFLEGQDLRDSKDNE